MKGGFGRNRLPASRVCATLMVFATSVLFPVAAARAEGAIAIGILDNDATKGYAAGWSSNRPTAADAEQLALENCRKQPNAPENVRATCRVVRNFVNQCVIVALDPKNGTPGAGWAVAETSELAIRDARRECDRTAGSDRQGQCTLTDGVCDGTAR